MRIRKRTGFNPFAMYLDMLQAGAHAAELVTSSAHVIAHRSELMSRAAKGDATVDYNEFMTMWMEKYAAGREAFAIGSKLLGRSRNPAFVFRDIMQTMAPYRKRVRANAKRLGK